MVQTITEVQGVDGFLRVLSVSSLVCKLSHSKGHTVEVKGNIQVKMVTAIRDKGRSLEMII